MFGSTQPLNEMLTFSHHYCNGKCTRNIPTRYIITIVFVIQRRKFESAIVLFDFMLTLTSHSIMRRGSI